MGNWLANNWRMLFLAALVLAGLLLLFFRPLTPETLLAAGERLATRPSAMVLTVFGMMVLFALALPGSLCFWLVAPFHSPLMATALLLTGSLGGAWGGYLLAGRLRGERVYGGPLGRLLQRRSDFLTQCALRILPGFPHSVINYVAGALRLPPATFLAAAALGLAVKWGVYSSAVHSMVVAVRNGAMVSWSTLWPLGMLAVLMLGGAWARARFVR